MSVTMRYYFVKLLPACSISLTVFGKTVVQYLETQYMNDVLKINNKKDTFT